MGKPETRPSGRDFGCETILPLVTLITPTYNRANYLQETIESVIAQDYPRIEYIVLDDGSTDDTRAILEKYGDRFLWESHDNVGQASTVNRGFSMARGELIGVVNSDDPLLPGALGPVVDALVAEPDVVAAYPDWFMIDEHGAVIGTMSMPRCTHLDMVRWALCAPGPGALFRHTVVDRIGGWDPSLHFTPDFDFFLRAGLLGPLRRVPRTLASWRAHPGSITTSGNGEAKAREIIHCIEKLYAQDGLPEELLAIRSEAFRNSYLLAGIVLDDDAAAPGNRFQIEDRIIILGGCDFIVQPSSSSPQAVIPRLDREAKRQDNDLIQMRDLMESREKAIERLHRDVAEQEARSARLRVDLTTREATTIHLRKRTAEREEEVTLLDQEVAKRDEAITRLCHELTVDAARLDLPPNPRREVKGI